MDCMDNVVSLHRPRLVFFQWDYRPNEKSAQYLLLHMQYHVKCLPQFFKLFILIAATK